MKAMSDRRYLLLSVIGSSLCEYGIEPGSVLLVDAECEPSPGNLLVTMQDGGISAEEYPGEGTHVGVILGQMCIAQILI